MTDSANDPLVERLRAGVRQQQAERTTFGDAGSAARLAELYRHQTLSERSPRSHRKLLGQLVVGVRTVVGENDWVRFLARPGVRGPVGAFRLHGGIGVFYLLNQQLADRLEIRPFQGISAIWPKWRRLRLRHYVRFEERLEWETADWTLDASLRGRYQLQVDYSFSGFTSSSDWRVMFHI